jgi:hypothetical protein
MSRWPPGRRSVPRSLGRLNRAADDDWLLNQANANYTLHRWVPGGPQPERLRREPSAIPVWEAR